MQFEAICIYHASLTMWAYSVVNCTSFSPTSGVFGLPQGGNISQSSTRNLLSGPENLQDLVWLDSGDKASAQRWISLGYGVPVICEYSEAKLASQASGALVPIPLHKPEMFMDSCIALLCQCASPEDDGEMLPLIANLCQLMRDLGYSARGQGNERIQITS